MAQDECGISTVSVNGSYTANGPDIVRSSYRAMEQTISSRILKRLDSLNLSARGASLAAGLSGDAIRNIQRAEREGKPYDPRSGTLAKIAAVLATSEEYLLHGRGDEDSPPDRLTKARIALAQANPRPVHAISNDATSKVRDAATIPEIDIRAGMGSGGHSIEEMYFDEVGAGQTRDAVRAEWGIPNYFLSENRLDARHTDIIEASGTSNEPELRAGDRLIVDKSHRVPSPEGYYALWDGFGVVVKALQLIPNTDPPKVRIISANPLFEPYERSIEEINIIGKISHVIKRL